MAIERAATRQTKQRKGQEKSHSPRPVTSPEISRVRSPGALPDLPRRFSVTLKFVLKSTESSFNQPSKSNTTLLATPTIAASGVYSRWTSNDRPRFPCPHVTINPIARMITRIARMRASEKTIAGPAKDSGGLCQSRKDNVSFVNQTSRS